MITDGQQDTESRNGTEPRNGTESKFGAESKNGTESRNNGLLGLPTDLPTPFSAPGSTLKPIQAGAVMEIEPAIARLEAEMERARRQGVYGLMRLRYEAWLEERMKGPAILKLQSRQALLEEQIKTAEAEIRLKAVVQSGERDVQRHKIQWNEVNRQRLHSELQSLGLIEAPAPATTVELRPASSSSVPPVSPHITAAKIEQLAHKAVSEGVQTEDEIETFRAVISQHLPSLVVEEVLERVRALAHIHARAFADDNFASPGFPRSQ